MNYLVYNYRKVPSYRPDQGVGSVSDPFQLHDSSFQHHSLRGANGDLGNYPVRNSRMFHVNEWLGKEEVGSFIQETCNHWRNPEFNVNSGGQQLVDSSSKLQNMSQHGIIDNPLVTRESSLSIYSSQNRRKVAAEESVLSDQTVASRFVECGGNNMVSYAGINQVVSDEVSPSPEQISSITVCSDGEPFVSGSAISKGLLSAMDPVRNSESNQACPLPVDLKCSNVDADNSLASNTMSLDGVLQYANFKSFPQKADNNRGMDISRAFCKIKRNVNGSPIHENIHPPPKRLRIQDAFVSENEPSNLPNPSEDEPIRNEESAHSGKSSEDPHCNYKEQNFVQKKIESHSKRMDGQVECGGVSVEIISDDQLRKTPERKKIAAVSLTDCFTAEQIKEHMISLNPSMGPSLGQYIIRGEKESTVESLMSENTCQLCSEDKLLFSPAPIYCAICCACIKRANYYWTLDKKDAKKICCTRCFKGSQGDSISLLGISFSKSELKREKNDAETEESWVQCDKCENWQHQICALYNATKDQDGEAKYTCPICRLQEIRDGEPLTLPAGLGAEGLPRTALSNHIEERLSVKLKAEREARAHKLGESIDKVPEAAGLTVRIVSSSDKLLKVKESFRNIFLDEDYPSEFPYKSKVILLFQKIDGADVCLYIMYAQEFGQNCAQPNQRRIHISYLDSVKYFRPHVVTVNGEALRTFVYQELMIGYIDYCKKQGFATCYIWACPPQKGEDYIFFCHPETQKSPRPDKLLQWYHLMLKKAMEEGIVLSYTNLYDAYFTPSKGCNTKITAARIPYFGGDFWTSKADEIISKVEIESGGDFQTNVKKVLRNRTVREMGHRLSNLTSNGAKDILLMHKLKQVIFPVKEQFILIHLLYTCKKCNEVLPGIHQHSEQSNNLHLCSSVRQNLNQRKRRTYARTAEHKISEIQVKGTPADTAENDIFDTRPYFLNFCQENHYQFGTLRRAKHSSMMILHHLHKQVPFTTGRTCSICLKYMVELAGWHCDACPKFDVCTTCYHENGEGCHIHKLIQFSPRFECGINKYQARQQGGLNLQAALDVLVHSSRCFPTKSKPCIYPGCSLLKKLFHHATTCKVRANGDCEKCKKSWTLLRVHSSHCSDGNCRVPRCMDINNFRKK